LRVDVSALCSGHEIPWLVFVFISAQFPPLAAHEEIYPVPPESVKEEGVPVGTVTKGVFDQSAIFPGTTREYAVYRPAQYDGSKPAALMVFQDGALHGNVLCATCGTKVFKRKVKLEGAQDWAAPVKPEKPKL